MQSAKSIEEYSKNDFAQYDKSFDDLKNKLIKMRHGKNED